MIPEHLRVRTRRWHLRRQVSRVLERAEPGCILQSWEMDAPFRGAAQCQHSSDLRQVPVSRRLGASVGLL